MSDVWCYIGRTVQATKYHEAGVVVCVTVDQPSMAKDNAREVAEWMRDGLTIERVPVEWARRHMLTDTPYVPGIAP